MNRTAVRSSNIKAIGFDGATLILEVEFKTGSIYQYLGVAQTTYDRFLSAPSKGRFFDNNVRERFKTVRIK